jgi:hypothetical protein
VWPGLTLGAQLGLWNSRRLRVQVAAELLGEQPLI